MPKVSSPFKHPRHMTTEEAMTHLFHPEVVEHIKKEKDAAKTTPKKRPLKKGCAIPALCQIHNLQIICCRAQAFPPIPQRPRDGWESHS